MCRKIRCDGESCKVFGFWLYLNNSASNTHYSPEKADFLPLDVLAHMHRHRHRTVVWSLKIPCWAGRPRQTWTWTTRERAVEDTDKDDTRVAASATRRGCVYYVTVGFSARVCHLRVSCIRPISFVAACRVPAPCRPTACPRKQQEQATTPTQRRPSYQLVTYCYKLQ